MFLMMIFEIVSKFEGERKTTRLLTRLRPTVAAVCVDIKEQVDGVDDSPASRWAPL